MKFKWFFVLAGSVFLLLVLGSCGGSGTPACPPGSLKAPTLIGPAAESVVDSLQPSLSWSYPDTTCNPQGYSVHLKMGPLLADYFNGSTGSPSTTWSPSSPLPSGQEFSWSVQAVDGATSGPLAGEDYFFTGPMCDTSSLASPNLLQPLNNAVVTTLGPSLIWQYPGACLPEAYRINLSTDAAFSNTSLSGGTGNPSTRWVPGEQLADCTVYFWKISPMNGSTLGPSSSVFRFSTQVKSTCATPTPTASPTHVIPTLTSTPAQFTFTTMVNAYCREGPDASFKVLGIAMAGPPYLMDGRDKDNRWYRIKISDQLSCYVSTFSGRASSDASFLPVLPEIPLYTPTPISCWGFTTPGTCEANSFCHWIWSGTVASGICGYR